MPAPRDDLFAVAADERLARRAPLAARMRPRTLDEVVGQEHLLGPGRPLRALVEADRLSSLILWGPPGTGKTTLARVVAATTASEFVGLSAVDAGVRDVREALEGARRRLGEQDRRTILFLDEVHRFNRAQQDALLPGVEEGLVVLVGATTENPSFSVNAPLLSRSTLFRLEPLPVAARRTLVERALAAEGATADDDALAFLAAGGDGDARAVLTTLEVALALAAASRRRGGVGPPALGEEVGLEPRREGTTARGAPPHVTLADAEAARGTRALRSSPDEHYDVTSAFVKSLRGSDPDAGLYWLARMVAAGEDPRFVARRLVVLASEDVGMADPTALLVATAAATAVERVGLPEAGLNLAQAVVHLATAPKSNRGALGWWRAQADVAELPAGPVPAHLRDAHYPGAGALGHGVGYRYPHDDPRGWLPQRYRPAEVDGRTYYEPGPHGAERAVADALAARREEPTARRGGRRDGNDPGPAGAADGGGG